jgi:hypothetical protein
LKFRPTLSKTCLLLFLCTALPALAAPGTFVTALPVAQNQALVRFNVQPLFGSGGYTNVQLPVNIGYGLTPKWALFMNVNQGFLSLDNHSSVGGAGDTLLFIRNTLFKIDKPSSTFRIAPLAGLYLPTGTNNQRANGSLAPGELQSGSGTVDPYAGITSGFNNTNVGAALDATYRYNPVASSGFSPGNQFRADGQFEFRVAPLHLPEQGLANPVVFSLESNYAQTSSSLKNGAFSGRSSSKTFAEDALLELATLHWELAGGVQVPLVRDFASPTSAKEHVGFYAFFEYYLAMPNWRHKARR